MKDKKSDIDVALLHDAYTMRILAGLWCGEIAKSLNESFDVPGHFITLQQMIVDSSDHLPFNAYFDSLSYQAKVWFGWEQSILCRSLFNLRRK